MTSEEARINAINKLSTDKNNEIVANIFKKIEEAANMGLFSTSYSVKMISTVADGNNKSHTENIFPFIEYKLKEQGFSVSPTYNFDGIVIGW